MLLSERGGEMKGVWLDGKRGCLDRRTLRVAIQIDLVSPAGKTTRVRRSRTGFVDNCAEGGPNFGFDLVAARARDGLRERPLAAGALLDDDEGDARRAPA